MKYNAASDQEAHTEQREVPPDHHARSGDDGGRDKAGENQVEARRSGDAGLGNPDAELRAPRDGLHESAADHQTGHQGQSQRRRQSRREVEDFRVPRLGEKHEQPRHCVNEARHRSFRERGLPAGVLDRRRRCHRRRPRVPTLLSQEEGPERKRRRHAERLCDAPIGVSQRFHHRRRFPPIDELRVRPIERRDQFIECVHGSGTVTVSPAFTSKRPIDWPPYNSAP